MYEATLKMNNYNAKVSNDSANYAVSNHLQELVENELDEKETIEWIDQPVSVFFSASTIGVFLLALPWTALSINWICGACLGVFEMVKREGIGWFTLFPLFGLPFLLIGLGMLWHPYWFYRQRKRTVYAITNQRVIVAIFGRKHDITSYTKDEIKKIKKTQKKNDDCGNVLIKNEENNEYELLFVNARNVKKIEQKLRHWKQSYKPETESTVVGNDQHVGD